MNRDGVTRAVLNPRSYYADILATHLPKISRETMWHDQHDPAALLAHCVSCEDQHCLRISLAEHGLVAFVKDGAILPRASGASDVPLPADSAVPFESPKSLRVTLPLKNGGVVCGMGMKTGVSLIVGGGFHGKSTLLDALKVRSTRPHVWRMCGVHLCLAVDVCRAACVRSRRALRLMHPDCDLTVDAGWGVRSCAG
jgi:predicted ABC-class ATPase